MKLKIVLADEHALFRKAVKNLLETTDLADKIYETSDAQELVRLLTKFKIDLLLLEIKFGFASNLDLARRISKQWPIVKVIILSSYDNEELVRNFLKIGIDGYLLKKDNNIEHAISIVMQGGFYYSPGLAIAIANTVSDRKTKPVTLTSKEARILRLLAEGKNSEMIAETLSLSRYTIESYRKEILSRFEVKNCAELIHYAHQTGML